MGFIMISAKITDDKKEGVVVIGPTPGQIRDTREEAEADARQLVNESKNCTVVPRVYEIKNITDIEQVIANAKTFFKHMYDNILEAKQAFSRPVYRRKKRRQRAATSQDKTYDIDE